MKINSSLLINRRAVAMLLLLVGFALCLPHVRADDTTPGVYQWVGPNRSGGDGDVTDGNNWDPDDSGPPGGSVPGKKDRVLISGINNSFGTHITLTGNLDVGSASIADTTMTGTVSTNGGLQAGGGCIFQKSVAAGYIESGDTTFNKPVVADLNSGIYGGVAFTADLFGPASTAATRFLTGSSLTSAGALQIQYGAVSFSGGATGIVNQAGVPVFLGLPASTAVFLIPGQIDSANPLNSYSPGTLNLSDSGTQFTAKGDLIVGVGGGDSTSTITIVPAEVNITGGAKLITDGKTFFGMYLPDDPQSPDGSGKLMVDGSGSTWKANGDIIVGAAAPRPRGPGVPPGPPSIAKGEITVANGGTLDATGHEIVLGSATGSQGTLTVEGSNSTATSNSIVVGSLGTGTLLVQDNAMLHNIGIAIVGQLPGGIGNATVIGTGAKWEIDGDLSVGSSATGTVAVADQGLLHTKGAAVLGKLADSKGTVSVGDMGSKWQADTTLTIGSFGTGILNIENQGLVQTTGNAVLGEKTGGIGTATVTGTGSKWQADTTLTIGSLGTGTLNIEKQGLVHTNGDATIGEQGGATGTATVTGLGSLWNLDANLIVGSLGTGTLNVQSQGLVVLASGNTILGQQAKGVLEITDQGKVFTGGDAVLGEQAGGNGTATITGMDALWQVTGTLVIGLAGDPMGQKGIGQITVKDGAELRVNGDFLTIGQEAGSQGTLTLDGVGSVYNHAAATTLEIGSHGDGTLEVKNGASVSLPSTILGVEKDGSGTILVDGKDPNGGPASMATMFGALTIGGKGAGTLRVTSGGQMITNLGAAIVGRDQNVTGRVTLAGQDSQWMINATGGTVGLPVPGNLTIGQDGTGIMAVSDHANFTAGSVVLGQNTNGNGTMTVTGSGGANDSSLTIASLTVGDTGTGTLNASNGAKLKTVADAVIGNQSTGNNSGTVTLDGMGTSWTLPTGALTIGKNGTGEVDATNSAKITTEANVILGDQNTHRGVVVLDSKASWQANGSQFIVGNNGTGVISIKNGASLMVTGFVLGGGPTGFGQATVSGDGAILKTTDQLNLGTLSGGRGLFTVADGGQVTSTVGGLAIRGGLSSIFVKGTGTDNTPSTLTVSSLTIAATQPTIDVSDKGFFKVNGGDINLTSAAIFTVESGGRFLAPGSALNLDPPSGSIAMKVMSGGTLTTGDATVRGSNTAVTIGQAGDASSSTWNLTAGSGQTGALSVNTLAHVDILDSGHIDAAGTVFLRNAFVDVNGVDASLTARSDLFVDAGGTLTVLDGQATAGNVLIVLGSGGNVRVNGSNASLVTPSATVSGAMSALNNGHISIGSRVTVETSGNVDVTGGGSVDIGLALGQAPSGQIRIGPGGSLKDNGTVSGNVVTLLGGKVGGSGTINGVYINGGIAAPGDPQTLTVNGDYQQLNGGLLQIAIAGKTMPEFDHLNVTGHVTLDMGAKLELDFINGFAPKIGDKFDFLQSGDAVITDNFSEVVITGLEPGFQFVLTPDGVGSFGLVALNDGVATTVPEPSTWLLLVGSAAALLPWLSWRRRRV